MATLHVRNVPEGLYKDLNELAREQKRSLSAEVIALLERAVVPRRRKEEQLALLDRMYRNRVKLPKGLPSIVDVIREGRER
jgi:plasmid stability protein